MSEAHAPPPLNAIEARILGCLIEKEATTPDVYPLTVNNIVMACNQKTARDPVMTLEQGAVHHALRQLEVRGLVRSQHTARAERYGHRFEIVYGLTPPQTALMSLLMLRGPQTVHELHGRSERLARFEGVDEVARVLERLMQKEPALVAILPRKSGQREDRFRHLLIPGEAIDDGEDEALYEAVSEPGMPTLRERVAALEDRVERLESMLTAIRPIQPATTTAFD